GEGEGCVGGEVEGGGGKGRQVWGNAAVNTGGLAEITSVSCAKAGGCSAGGSYRAAPFKFQAFVAGEANGVWGKAQQVPGIAALNTGGVAAASSVSCAKGGGCSAGGVFIGPSRPPPGVGPRAGGRA